MPTNNVTMYLKFAGVQMAAESLFLPKDIDPVSIPLCEEWGQVFHYHI